MSGREEVLSGTTIVLVGEFDVSTAQPERLVKEGLIRQSDLVDLNVTAFFADVASYSISWLSVAVEPKRMALSTRRNSPLPEPVRDFTVGFLEAMPGARISQLGLNSSRHFQVRNLATFNAIDNMAVPKEPMWTQLIEGPALRTVSVRGGRPGGRPGFVEIKVEPSLRVEQGMYVLVTDHFDAVGDSEPLELLDVLSTDWTERLAAAENIIDTIQRGELER